jgi:hypothetical protein
MTADEPVRRSTYPHVFVALNGHHHFELSKMSMKQYLPRADVVNRPAGITRKTSFNRGLIA